jgi:hypothetical protein
VAIWRSPELETLFGGPLDSSGITDASIRRLVTEQVPEMDQLDFKGALYAATRGPSTGWSSEQEFAKDVAALANYRGGIILVGVEESKGLATRTVPVTLSTTPELEERRLRQSLINYQAPVVSCSLVWVPAPSCGYLLLRAAGFWRWSSPPADERRMRSLLTDIPCAIPFVMGQISLGYPNPRLPSGTDVG